jgi:putative ABC transport system permease protein
MGAGLLSNSFLRLTQVDKGYDPTGVLALQLVLPDGYAPARTVAAIEHILQRLRAIPGVQEAGFSYVGVLVGIQNTLGSFVPPGWAVETVAGDVDRPRLKSLSAGYLESIGARVARGRLLTDADGATAAPVVVVNRTVAHRYFGTSDCVGSYMDWHNQDRQPVRVQIVGVIDDVRQGSIDREPYPEIFMDYRQLISIQRAWGVSDTLLNQLAFGFMSFAIRTERDLPATVPLVRQALMDVEPNAGIDAIAPLDHLVASSIAKPRFYAVLLDLFAGVAALLAAIGVYGVLAYTVVQRRQEIGVRMALGAARSQVVKLILWRGLAVTVAGLTTGVAAAAALTRYLSGMLYGVTALDPATYAAVVLLFTLVALVASYLPARRATTIDPIVALRVD